MNTSTLHGCSTQKLHENSTNLCSLCVTWAKKKCLLFSFSLTHTLTVSLYFFTRTAPPQAEALTCVSLTMAEWLSFCFNYSLKCVFLCHTHWPNGLSFLFLLFSSACLTHLLSFALNQKLTLEHFWLRSQTSPCFGHCLRNGMLTLEAWEKQAH